MRPDEQGRALVEILMGGPASIFPFGLDAQTTCRSSGNEFFHEARG